MILKQELSADPRNAKQRECGDIVLIVTQRDVIYALETLPRVLANLVHTSDHKEKLNDIAVLADMIELFGDHLQYCVEE